jgi:hypothetical protein
MAKQRRLPKGSIKMMGTVIDLSGRRERKLKMENPNIEKAKPVLPRPEAALVAERERISDLERKATAARSQEQLRARFGDCPST